MFKTTIVAAVLCTCVTAMSEEPFHQQKSGLDCRIVRVGAALSASISESYDARQGGRNSVIVTVHDQCLVGFVVDRHDFSQRTLVEVGVYGDADAYLGCAESDVRCIALGQTSARDDGLKKILVEVPSFVSSLEKGQRLFAGVRIPEGKTAQVVYVSVRPVESADWTLRRHGLIVKHRRAQIQLNGAKKHGADSRTVREIEAELARLTAVLESYMHDSPAHSQRTPTTPPFQPRPSTSSTIPQAQLPNQEIEDVGTQVVTGRKIARYRP